MKRLVVCAVAAALSSVACVGPEEEILERYLLASQRGDSPTVAALSMVAFPEDDVQSWNILEISALRTEPYDVPALRETVGRAGDERDAQFKVFGEFRRVNYESLRRIQARQRDEPDYHFSGRLGELQDEWDAFRVERRQVVAKLHDAEIAFEREIRRVNKSLQRKSSPEYLTGEMLLKNARVRVTTELGDGQFDFTLTQYALKNQFDALVPARWIITAVEKTNETP